MHRTNALTRSLLVALFVALGIAAAWAMAEQWVFNIVHNALQRRGGDESIYLTVTGDPVIARNSSQGETEKIETLAGEPLNINSQDLLYLDASTAQEKPRFAPRAPEWTARLLGFNDSGVPPIYWYIVHDGQTPGHAYGIGFHAATKKTAGYFSRRGFAETPPPRDDWFEVQGTNGLAGLTTIRSLAQEPRWSNGSPRFLFLADGKVWKIDFAKRQITSLLDCPQAFGLGQAWRILDKLPDIAEDAMEARSANSITPTDGLVREPDSLVIVHQQSGEHTRYPLPADLRGQMLAAALLPNRQLLLIAWPNWWADEEHLVWLEPSGQIARRQTVRRKTRYEPPSLTWVGWQMAIAAPLPIANIGYTTIAAPQGLLAEKSELTYPQALATVLRSTWLSVLTVLALGAISAVFAYRRQRRFGLSHGPAWAIFVFLFGLPGYLAYRFHRTWPVLEECPACHQPSPRDRQACLDCGATFPPPPLKGIEVFA